MDWMTPSWRPRPLRSRSSRRARSPPPPAPHELEARRQRGEARDLGADARQRPRLPGQPLGALPRLEELPLVLLQVPGHPVELVAQVFQLVVGLYADRAVKIPQIGRAHV